MAVFVNETFGGTAGQLLTTYNPAWTAVSGLTDATITDAGRLRGSAAGSGWYQHAGVPASADYHVSADFVYVGVGVTEHGVAGRITASTTYYFTRFESGDQVINLYKLVSGATTLLTSVAASLSVGQTLRLTLEMIGTAIKVYRDGSEVISVTDSSITGAGKAGLRLTVGVTQSDSVGVHIDNFEAADGALAADVTAPVLSLPTGTTTGTTTASGTVTTDEANGTLYAVVTASATPPSAADIRAGTGAVYATSQAVSTTGVQNVAATGLTAETTYYWHFLHDDAAANASNIVSSASFTTDAIVASGVTVTEPLKNNTGTLLASQSGITVAILQASNLASVNEQTGLSTNASGLLPLIESVSIIAGTSYHVAIKLADGSVGITGPIVAS